MKNRGIFIALFLAGLSFLTTACLDEKFSTDPTHILSFSTEIVRFNTLFTGKGSATLSFRVYNRNSDAVRIESVRLADADRSGFYINVDGEKGPNIESIELQGKDSLYVFVEATIPPTEVDTPFVVRDSIVFCTNGKEQDVKLEAYGQNATVFQGGKLFTADTTLTAERPFLIYDSLIVTSGATLTLTEGTTLYLHDKAFLRIDGRMVAQGSAERRVTLRGDRTDNLFSNLPYDYYSGQWGGIEFGPESYENVWDYADMHGSSWGIRIDSGDVARPKLTLQHSIVHNATSHLISASHARINGYNCQLTNAGGALLNLTDCPSEWIQCTVSNLYSWDIISSAALTLTGYTLTDSLPTDEQPILLLANCIVTGRSTLLSPNDIEGMAVTFDNCLFQAEGEDDDNFVRCLWGKDPAFVSTGENYIFDFRLTEESPARESGSIDYLTDATLIDLYGESRPTDGTLPDIGASNYTSLETEEE